MLAYRVLSGGSAGDPDCAPHATFTQELAQLGWTDGRNVRIDYRWAKVCRTKSANTRRKLLRLAATSS